MKILLEEFNVMKLLNSMILEHLYVKKDLIRIANYEGLVLLKFQGDILIHGKNILLNAKHIYAYFSLNLISRIENK